MRSLNMFDLKKKKWYIFEKFIESWNFKPITTLFPYSLHVKECQGKIATKIQKNKAQKSNHGKVAKENDIHYIFMK